MVGDLAVPGQRAGGDETYESGVKLNRSPKEAFKGADPLRRS